MEPLVTVVGGYGVGMTVRTARVPERGETIGDAVFSAGPGGKASNQAVGVARLGVRAALVSAVGDDSLGAGARPFWDDESVDHAHVATVYGAATMVGTILVEPDGENRIIVSPGALDHLGAEHARAATHVLAASDLVLISQEVPEAVVVEALRVAHENGVRTQLNPAPGRALPPGTEHLVDVLTPNASEARLLAGLPPAGDADATDDPSQLIGALREVYPAATLVLTRGAEGAVVDAGEGVDPGTADGSRRFAVPAPGVTPVDTTGAGDAFNAALAVALVRGRPLHDAVRYAVAAGAFAVTRHEVIPGLGRPDDLAPYLS
ncbi:MAG TPA: ribokinase [Actinomycetales bacterium]|nr:ribokinase [Actinomycetales bacterium]